MRKRIRETIASLAETGADVTDLFDPERTREKSERSARSADRHAEVEQGGRSDLGDPRSPRSEAEIVVPVGTRPKRTRRTSSRSRVVRPDVFQVGDRTSDFSRLETDVPREDFPGFDSKEQANGFSQPHDGIASKAAALPRVSVKWDLVVLAIAPVLAGAILAYLVAVLSPNVYAAYTEVVFHVRDLGSDRGDRFLATQVVIAESQSTLAPVAAAFGMSLKELEEDFDVDIIGSSGMMSLRYESSDAPTALAVVNAITDRYLLTLRELERVEGGSHRLLTPATLMEEPVAPKPLRAVAIGAAAGLAIAAAGVVLRTQLWPTR